MSEYSRRVSIYRQLCQYCIVCGTHLVKVEEEKRCPKGHGVLDIEPSWDLENKLPLAIFELDRGFFEEVSND